MQSSTEAQERLVLERLRERYEGQGYSFFIHPAREFVPTFLGAYRPDAIALKGDGGVVVEVKVEANPKSPTRLSELAKLFVGQSNWRLEVVTGDAFGGKDEIEAFSKGRIESELGTVERLIREGHFRPAFIVAWSVLEATARALGTEFAEDLRRPIGSTQIPELLARNGLISQGSASLLRDLAGVRNAVVHGDLGATVSARDVAELQKITEELLEHLQQPA